MDIAYFNGKFLPRGEIMISPDDRGFLFADGIYDVAIWYNGLFYDIEGHHARLKRSLKELHIDWKEENTFPEIAGDLILRNNLENTCALVYFQVTRGAALRRHDFPSPPVNPTIYGYAKQFRPDNSLLENGVKVVLTKDIRWSRCDIKSISLLANVLEYQKAKEQGFYEAVFDRNGFITEATHANIAFVIDGAIYTHPESEFILSGITRKNVLRIARENIIPVIEEALATYLIDYVNEAFLLNTSGEITPVIAVDNTLIANGIAGPVTRLLQNKFKEDISKKQSMK
jgi:D-alanine transaminase